MCWHHYKEVNHQRSQHVVTCLNLQPTQSQSSSAEMHSAADLDLKNCRKLSSCVALFRGRACVAVDGGSWSAPVHYKALPFYTTVAPFSGFARVRIPRAVLQLYTSTGRAGYLFSDQAVVHPSNATSSNLVKGPSSQPCKHTPVCKVS